MIKQYYIYKYFLKNYPCSFLSNFFSVATLSATRAQITAFQSDEGGSSQRLLLHLTALFSSETTPVSLRTVAGSCVQNLVRLIREDNQKIAIFGAAYMVCKLLRAPDTLRCSGCVCISLKLLLDTMQTAGTAGAKEWKWLIRYLYDRRSAVRLLALNVLERVISIVGPEAFGGNDGMSTASSDSVIIRIFQDTSESKAVRAKAASIYCNYYLLGLSVENIEDFEVVLGQLIRALCDGIDTSTSW